MIPTIKLGTFDLNDQTTYVVNKLAHDSGTPYVHNILEIEKQDGAKLISSSYAPKKINIEGFVRGTSRDNLEENINSLKRYMSVSDEDLTIQYYNGYRTYNVTCDNLSIIKNPRDILSSRFQISYSVLSPIQAKDTDSDGNEIINEMWSFDNLTNLNETFSVTLEGNSNPKPKFNIFIDSYSDVGGIVLRNNSTMTEMSVYTGLSNTYNGDEFEIDCDKLSVIHNNPSLDSQNPSFKGKFIENKVGTNRYTIEIPSSISEMESCQKKYNSYERAYFLSNKQILFQSFKVQTSGNYNRIALLLNPNNSSSGLRVYIKADNNGKPGNEITYYSYYNISPTLLKEDIDSGADYTWGIVTFDNVALTVGTTYWIGIQPDINSEKWDWACLKNSSSDSKSYYYNVNTTVGFYEIKRNAFTYIIYMENLSTFEYSVKAQYNKRYL
jgi:hypothetical protein